MQLKSLRMFLAVCDSGSFGAAAQQLHTVQSNVTAHVKKLEDEAGVQLIERSAPVHATPAGRLLERYARRMLADHDESLALLQGSARAAGALRIGSMETTAALRLPPLLARLHQAQPGLDLELRTATTAELLADLLAGRLDCAFVSGMPPQSRLQGWKVFEEELVLVTAFALQRFPDAAQLSAMPFLAFRQGCSYRQRIELLLAARGVAARIMEMGSLDAILGCVAAGMGYGLLPRSVVQAQQHRFGVHITALPGALAREVAHVETWFAVPARTGWSPALHACVGLLGIGGQADGAGAEEQIAVTS
ncbi:HTH-type transcriptional regulator gltR [Delftia tsuruhatensis]|uniref:LysR family transcriptional regulator n=1 Tax=Delftia tsuruhatensis TaxID=180282 RepID=UPI001E777566|nr:LysR family transcriptional regulator [Delftia tsuruhatensis]CAB5684087.1 HTH-type transcriptional regulator gltR [Delftia tsuruhatensis]CAC9675992.1 HTH-type transcriptional regulator gltR [Delftia tsuruhatensis]